MNGGSNEERLNGTFFLRQTQQEVIVVVANYRLSVFGFLGGSELRDSSASGTTGNWGMLDQRMAMQWTHDHIAAFGGDPDQVMIFGESAGAGSVANHLVRKASMPLYASAAAESGAFAEWIANPEPWAQAQYDTLLQLTDCTNATCLRGLTADAVKAAAPKAGGTASPVPLQGFPSQLRCVWAPVIDGVELEAHPATMARAGEHANVPFLLGSNRDEGASFIGGNCPKKATLEDFNNYLLHHLQLNASAAAAASQLYNPSAYNDTACCSKYFWAASRALGDLTMTCASLNAANWWVTGSGYDLKSGSSSVKGKDQSRPSSGTSLLRGFDTSAPSDSSATPPVFKYFFQHAPDEKESGNEFAYHSADIRYVWHVDPLLDPADGGTQVANYMNAYWANFASTANPNEGPLAAADLPTWPVFDASSQMTLHIGDNVTGTYPASSHVEKCAFWQQVGYLPGAGTVGS